MPTKRSPFIRFIGEPDLYVEAKYSGINPLVQMIDGLPYCIYKPKGRKERYYMKVPVVIAWHEKELKESNGQSGNKKVLEILKAKLKEHYATLANAPESNPDGR